MSIPQKQYTDYFLNSLTLIEEDMEPYPLCRMHGLQAYTSDEYIGARPGIPMDDIAEMLPALFLRKVWNSLVSRTLGVHGAFPWEVEAVLAGTPLEEAYEKYSPLAEGNKSRH